MPSTAGARTREKIMNASEQLILNNGFTGTSIDAIIDQVGITKGAFFYHFPTKVDLARALIARLAATDLGILRSYMERAEKLSRDPLQQLLIFIGLFIEEAEEMTEPYPGCLFASFVYESGQFEQGTLRVVSDTLLTWREELAVKIREATALHPPKFEVDAESLADMINVLAEGAYIFSRVLKEPGAFARQLRHLKNYLELLFT